MVPVLCRVKLTLQNSEFSLVSELCKEGNLECETIYLYWEILCINDLKYAFNL